MKKCYLNIPGDPRIVVSTVLLVSSVITPVLISPYAEARIEKFQGYIFVLKSPSSGYRREEVFASSNSYCSYNMSFIWTL